MRLGYRKGNPWVDMVVWGAEMAKWWARECMYASRREGHWDRPEGPENVGENREVIVRIYQRDPEGLGSRGATGTGGKWWSVAEEMAESSRKCCVRS
jgi:hypothetical protein